MNRELLIIALIVFVTSLFTRSVDPVVPLIADGLTVQIGTAALLSTAFALPYAVIQPVFGALADMMSKTKLMSICLVILVLSALVSATAPDFTVLMLSRVAAGLASGGIFPTSLATVGDRIPVAQRQVAISRLLAATMTGNLLGASLAGVVGDLAGWRAVFVVVGMLGLIAMVTALIGFRKLTPPPPAGFDLSTIGPNYRAIFAQSERENLLRRGVRGIARGVRDLSRTWRRFSRKRARPARRLPASCWPDLGSARSSTQCSCARLLHLVGEKRLMLGGGLIMAAFLLILTLRLPWPLEFANFMMLGFGFYWLHGSIQVYATELAPQARGSAMALHSASFFLGQAAGPIVYGAGFATIGKTPLLVRGAIVIALVGLLCSRMLHRAPATTI